MTVPAAPAPSLPCNRMTRVVAMTMKKRKDEVTDGNCADDILKNGTMDLVVTTDEGDLYLIGSNAPYDPLWAWTSPSR